MTGFPRLLADRAGLLRLGVYVAVWLLLSAVIAAGLFLSSEREIDIAGHQTDLRPTLTGQLVVDSGPVLPDLRAETGERIGVHARLGKTDVQTPGALAERYAVLASNPDGVRARIEQAVTSMATDAAVKGGLLGAVPLLLWWLLGPRRHPGLGSDLVHGRDGVVLATAIALLAAGLTWPWTGESHEHEETRWVSLQEFLGAEVPVPEELSDVEISADMTTRQTRRLLLSAVDTYEKSQEFYATAAEKAEELELREPEEGETVVTLISDRHDNVGMDAVARAIGDAAGATSVLNAGDDTSTGSTWEGFSLDSVTAAFSDQDRWSVTGNHDHGDFVGTYLAEQGWQVLDGEPVEGPDGGVIFGVPDPRSSGLGNWRDETEGMSFGELREWVADEVCAADEEGNRVNTVLLHDANLGREALSRGCIDLVVGGHVHTQVGPTAILGENGSVGYTYTTGTTGGAAYAIAMGSKIKRPAQISLVTYRDGRPVGLQSVILDTNGLFRVRDYIELDELSPVRDGGAAGQPQPEPGPGAGQETNGNAAQERDSAE